VSQPFDLQIRTRIVFGDDSVERLGKLTAELGVKRALVVTDEGLVGAGHVDRAENFLRRAGVEFARFSDVHENPTDLDVESCAAVAREFAPDGIIGIGGGSSIDVAKGTDFLLSCGGKIQDYWGVGKATGEMLPLIAVPTTAGTGTETQSFALITDHETKQKMACGDVRLSAKLAILDPVLSLTMPPLVTACTGLDTIGHAVETAVTKKRNPISSFFSEKAFTLAARSFPRVLAAPTDIEARGDMLRAAAFGGLAIENSMLGAAHSLANPLTARFDVPHGQAVAMMLPHVVRFNAEALAPAEAYFSLARAIGLCGEHADMFQAVEALAQTLQNYVAHARLPLSLAELGITNGHLPELAEEAARQWTAQFNPREVGEKDLLALYEQA